MRPLCGRVGEDEAGSQGYVVYAIDALPGLSPGTELTNTAHIFFDYNDPIITNTTLNTIEFPVGMGEMAGLGGQLVIYPNPGTDVFRINSDMKGEHVIEFLNTMGQKVLSTRSATGIAAVDAAHLPSGLYTVLLRNGEHTQSGRVVKW